MTRQFIDARAAAVEFERWSLALLDRPDDEALQGRVEKLRLQLVTALITMGAVHVESTDRDEGQAEAPHSASVR